METPNRAATYNKYTDSVIHPIHMSNNNSSSDRRHLEDLTNQQHSDPNSDVFTVHHTQSSSRLSSGGEPKENMALVIDTDAPTNVSFLVFVWFSILKSKKNCFQDTAEEMEKKKEKIMLMSLQRRQRQEEDKARKELEQMQRREREREKEEEKIRKKEEQVAKRAAILEHHRLKKAIEEAEREVSCFFFNISFFVIQKYIFSAGKTTRSR